MNELINECYKLINDRMHVIPLRYHSHKISFISKHMHWVWGIESDVRGGRGHMSFHLHVVGPV